MFGSGKAKKPVANSLRAEATPNSLSWPASEIAGDEYEPQEPEPAEDLDEPDLDEPDPEGPDPDEPDPDEPDPDEPDPEGPDLDEPDPAQRRAALQTELDRQAEEFGLANVSPVLRYGPHGEDVEAVFIALDDVKFGEVDPETLRQLADGWQAVDPEAALQARRAIRGYRVNRKYADRLETAESELSSWRPARPPEDPDGIELQRVAVEAATDAVDALILQDALDDEDFETLYGPWRDVMGAAPSAGAEDAEGEAAGAERAEGGGAEAGEGDAGGVGRAEAGGAERGEKPPTLEKPDEGFGPNAELVRAFLTRLGELTQDELRDLNAAFRRQWQEDLDEAHDAVYELVDRDPTWRDHVKAAQSWVESSLRPMSEMVARRLSDRLPVDKARALPPAVDAVTALTLRGVLDAHSAEVLYRPWAEVGDAAERADGGG